jgi:hypothetical protein
MILEAAHVCDGLWTDFLHRPDSKAMLSALSRLFLPLRLILATHSLDRSLDLTNRSQWFAMDLRTYPLLLE